MAAEMFFDLQKPCDLFHKLEREHKRWISDPLNSDLAWNFFVTAEHLPDWLARTNSQALGGLSIKDFRNNNPLLRICSHLANGGKHLKPRPERHNSVGSTRQQPGWVPLGWVPDGWVELPALIVDLKPDEQQALSLPSASLDALSLADQVLAFWQPYF